MRALLAIAVLSFAAPTVANACAMRMERPEVNLAELMAEVDEPEVKEPVALVTNVVVTPAEDVEVEEVEVEVEVEVETDAQAEVPTTEPVPVVQTQS